MLATPQDVTKFTPRLSPRAEQYEGTRLVFRIGPRSSSGSAFPIESGSDFPIGIKRPTFGCVPFVSACLQHVPFEARLRNVPFLGQSRSDLRMCHGL